MPAAEYLWIENMIARAHKQLWGAGTEADRMGLRGIAFDLEQIVLELERIQTDLLRSARRPPKSPSD